MGTFSKRTFEGFGHFGKSLGAVWAVRGALPGILSGKSIPAPFRERLMLAITAVNRCRYCAFVHCKAALSAGVSREQLDGIFAHDFANAPEEERVALAYAQHWAEMKGHPDADAVAKIEETYGAEMARTIEATLVFMNLNNLSGNTVDWVLNKISFGALGGGS